MGKECQLASLYDPNKSSIVEYGEVFLIRSVKDFDRGFIIIVDKQTFKVGDEQIARDYVPPTAFACPRIFQRIS